jgi:hypothetical protein
MLEIRLPVINRLLMTTALLCLSTLARSAVVINEIHHDPDVKTELAEFIELHNTGDEPVDLSGWVIEGAIAFTIPDGSKLDGGAFVVVAHNPAQFKAKFGDSPLGPWLGKLDNDGERIELRDATGQLVDRVRYRLGFPWPIVGSPPGYSIELIHPDLDNNDGHNWKPSVRGDASTKASTLIAKGSSWKYFKGKREASSPRTAWREADFTESSWLTGRTPIGYGENFIETTLSDMRNGYTSVYFRKKFTIKDAKKIGALKLALQFDDGFNMWINGRHVAGNNMSTKEPRFSTNATSSAIEQHNFVEFDLPSPGGYLVEGENILAIQAHNASKGGSSDFFIDVELKATVGPANRGPTPGARNSVFATEPLPRLAKVEHRPRQPKGGESVVITAVPAVKDDDSQIYTEYQVIEPGSYVHIDDAAYGKNWVNLAMNDLGQAGDVRARDGIFSATIPNSIQQHRHLIRYRVSIKTALGQVATAPYPGDPSPNFAYFCYDGVPSWRGKAKPGAKVVEYDNQALTRVPVYHLISKKPDVENSTWNEKYGGDNYKWKGTLVYDGEVYDHIRYRARGGVWRYAMGKNMWKFDFNRGHSFQARDHYGREYDTRWDKLNFSACIQQGNFQHRGEQGMFEAVGFKLFELASVEAPKTHWVHFRIIDEAAETGATQHDGDFWGLYLVLEQMDGRFLDEHSLPDGNLYKMEGGTGELNNQGPMAVTNKSDLNSYLSRYQGNPSESWWRQNMDLPRYYSYRTVVEGIHHYDIGYGKNYFYYLNPETQQWSTLPWDLDLTWAGNMYGNGNDPFKGKVLGKSIFKIEYGNRAREILDLLFNDDEGDELIDELAAIIDEPNGQMPSIVDADRAMWDHHPIMSSGRVNSSKAGKGRFYQKAGTKDFPGMVKIMKNYIRTRRNFILNSAARDTKHPDQPTIEYSGGGGHPVNGLRFRSSAFSDSSGKFAGMKWRLAEVTAPDAPPYDPSSPRQYEINANWESDVLSEFTEEIALPSGLAKVSHWYRARVRMLDDTKRWSHWSDPVEFRAGEPDTLESLKDHLVLSELMYNAPAGPDFDYLELHNSSTDTTLDLGGVALSGGVRFIAPTGLTLAPGQYALVIGHDDEVAFRGHYRLAVEATVLGTYTGNLANNGETIQVRSATDGTVLITLHYDDEDNWPQAADGNGRSLVPLVLDPAGQALGALDSPGNWQPSAADGGSPGQKDSPAPADDDQDGLPDDWELAHGLNPEANDAALDFDSDGANNAHEFLAGTNPGDATSRLSLGLSLGQAGGLMVEFTMRPGRQYFLETAAAVDGEWLSMPDNVYQPAPGAVSETIQVPQSGPETGKNRFFRLRVKRLAE